jgi:hypothetical protein
MPLDANTRSTGTTWGLQTRENQVHRRQWPGPFRSHTHPAPHRASHLHNRYVSTVFATPKKDQKKTQYPPHVGCTFHIQSNKKLCICRHFRSKDYPFCSVNRSSDSPDPETTLIIVIGNAIDVSSNVIFPASFITVDAWGFLHCVFASPNWPMVDCQTCQLQVHLPRRPGCGDTPDSRPQVGGINPSVFGQLSPKNNISFSLLSDSCLPLHFPLLQTVLSYRFSILVSRLII